MAAVIASAADQHEQESYMASSFLDFSKAVSVSDTVSIDKSIFVESFALFNSAIGNATADALGAWTHTETLTQTLAVQGVGSSSASESVSAANPAFPVTLDLII
jgi:Na+-driven multidrug efflux pump